jgi:hypothetical protein
MTSDRQKTVTCYSFARSRCPGPSTLVSSDYQAAAGSRRYALQGLGSSHVREASIDRRAGLLFACRTERRYDHSLQGVTTQTGACDN